MGKIAANIFDQLGRFNLSQLLLPLTLKHKIQNIFHIKSLLAAQIYKINLTELEGSFFTLEIVVSVV